MSFEKEERTSPFPPKSRSVAGNTMMVELIGMFYKRKKRIYFKNFLYFNVIFERVLDSEKVTIKKRRICNCSESLNHHLKTGKSFRILAFTKECFAAECYTILRSSLSEKEIYFAKDSTLLKIQNHFL